MATTVFDLQAVLGLDSTKFQDGLSKAKGVATAGLKAIGTAAKVGAEAVGAASVAVGALVTKSVEAYGEYEQLAGGVSKLYGNAKMSLEEFAEAQGKTSEEVRADWERNEKAEQLLMENASKAFRTAGMSANEYMATATEFSASLIQSLGGDTVKAAELTDVAMRAMSDNVNTFGTDAQLVSNAFRGLSMGNFMMLDNLKLGYKGTAAEMARLINDSKVMGDTFVATEKNVKDISFDKYIEAIQAVQEQQQIAGTTAKEAATTIQGSLTMVKGAWENLLTGMGDGNADLDQLMSDLVDSIVGYTDEAGNEVNGLVDNIIPIAEKALESVGSLIDKLAPKIAEEIPALIKTVLPSLLSAGADVIGSLVEGVTEALPSLLWALGDAIESILQHLVTATKDEKSVFMDIVNTIVMIFEENYMLFMDMGAQILTNIINGITNGLPEFFHFASEIIMHFGETIVKFLPKLISAAAQIITTFAEGITEALPDLIPLAVEILLQFVDSLIDNLPMLVDTAIQLILAFAEGIMNALPILIEKLPEIITSLIDAIITALPTLIDGLIQLVTMIVENLPTIIQALVDAAPQIISAIVDGLITAIPQLIAGLVLLVIQLVAHMPEIIKALIDAIPQVITAIIDAFADLGPRLLESFSTAFEDVGPAFEVIGQFFEDLWNDIVEFFQRIGDSVMEFFQPAIDKIKEIWNAFYEFFKPAIDAFKYLFETIFEAIRVINEKIWTAISTKIKEVWDKIVNALKPILDKIKNFVSETWNKIKESISNLLSPALNKAQEIFGKLKDKISEIFHRIIDSARSWGKDMLDNFIGGIRNKIESVASSVREVADRIRSYLHFSQPDEGPLADFATYAPDMMKLFAKGIKDNEGLLTDQISKTFDFGDRMIGSVATAGGPNISGGYGGNNQVISLLEQILEQGRNVTVTLEGDANRIFRVVKTENAKEYAMTRRGI